jgi:UDP-N-acetyl-D-galactosamine dehydrogenase
MTTVAVIGLGYVGLPLAIEFGKRLQTIGYDLATDKVHRLRQGIDATGEVQPMDFELASRLAFADSTRELAAADFIVVAVPTPIDSARLPDFGPLISASRLVGANMRKGATVVFESTVYPGATEEICIPVLEQASGYRWKKDFHVGYSPERINPGDKEHRLGSVVKVVSGDDGPTLDAVAELYATIVPAGVHRASSIKVAEAAKVIENTQRDLNIALMNELALICGRIGIDTQEVLRAAGTKWNFLRFSPGLVGGHCIGVDPYYLTYKAEMLGYHPQVILAGRRINDCMGKFVAEQTVKRLASQGFRICGERVIVLGLTFKEDVSDLRNSRVVDIVRELQCYGVEVLVHDPIADPEDARREYGVDLLDWSDLPEAAAVILAVPHVQYRQMGADAIIAKLARNGVFMDVKSAFDWQGVPPPEVLVWRL